MVSVCAARKVIRMQRNTLGGLFVPAAMASIAIFLGGCHASLATTGPATTVSERPKNPVTSRNCACTCRAKTVGGSTFLVPQKFTSNDVCGASDGAACFYSGTYNGQSVIANGALEQCAETAQTGRGRPTNVVPGNPERHQ